MNIHLTNEARPEIARASDDRVCDLRFFGDGFPEITLFAKTPAHRRWMLAMAAASAEFWRREDEALKTARAA
ncbi:MAG: hypothetical protein KIT32_12125 [Rhodocyclaceae bacterium]|nr:hypothetical protein [Rhodocyclaceae bacterium]